MAAFLQEFKSPMGCKDTFQSWAGREALQLRWGGAAGVYSRAMLWACPPPILPISWASWTRAQHGQKQWSKISDRNDPSSPFCSLIFCLIWAGKKMFAMGTRRANPHNRQFSPTASAFFPAV